MCQGGMELCGNVFIILFSSSALTRLDHQRTQNRAFLIWTCKVNGEISIKIMLFKNLKTNGIFLQFFIVLIITIKKISLQRSFIRLLTLKKYILKTQSNFSKSTVITTSERSRRRYKQFDFCDQIQITYCNSIKIMYQYEARTSILQNYCT